MLQVYDRVLSRGSHSTQAMFTILMGFLLVAMGGFLGTCPSVSFSLCFTPGRHVLRPALGGGTTGTTHLVLSPLE